MGASLPFFSGVARWATVGAHLGAMALPVMPIAPKCAPTNRWVRARMFEKLAAERSEEHTSELQSLMRISYAVFCLKKKKRNTKYNSSVTTIKISTSTNIQTLYT